MKTTNVALLALSCGLASAGLAPIPTKTIAPGVEMPILGLGSCCGLYNVTAWIELGGRHIDTSPDYGSHAAIGEAIVASGVPRSEFFITSKVNPHDFGTDMMTVVQEQLLNELNTTYVDLVLIHLRGGGWGDPPACANQSDPRGTFYECRLLTWKSLIEVQKSGKARAIGVSNFLVPDLEQVINETGVVPAVNQIEFHPYWHQDDVIQYCRQNSITITSYAPIANDGAKYGAPILADPAVIQVANETGFSAGQVIQMWERQYGADIVIPRSKTPAHMLENAALLGHTLSTAQMASLSNLPQKKCYPNLCPGC